jgi:hypothetical protein
MNTRTLPHRKHLLRGIVVFSLTAAAACGDNPTAPDLKDPVVEQPPTEPNTEQPTSITRGSVSATGDVKETEDGFTVDGELAMNLGDTSTVVFHNADVQVHFDATGRMTGMTGTVQIPSPHQRITFEDPVQAHVGMFSGRYLNQNADLPILLRDDTDYFVYDVKASYQMNIATGETGEDAVKPLAVRAPLGGRITMVVDYTDPMYFTYGALDLLGSSGVAWSLHHRLPFKPWNPVENLGSFEGGTERVGSMTIFKILGVEGQLVENEDSEVHLLQEDPFASDLRAGYQSGFNGNGSLDLFVKDVVGIDLPLASVSGGVWSELSTGDGFQGHLYARGRTTNDYSWWPTFIPARPVATLDVHSFVKSDGQFDVALRGEYGWDFPAGRQSMIGEFDLSNEAFTLEGTMVAADDSLSVGGVVTREATTLYVQPPQELFDGVSKRVNDEVLSRIDEAQKAWENLQKATEDYEIELSLRGLRSALPSIADQAKAELQKQVSSAIAGQKGKIWYSDFKSHMNKTVAPYYRQLDALKAAAADINDNQQSRDAIESALRGLAAKKIFSTTYKYTKPIVGTLYSRKITVRVMTDAQAAKLVEAANNVRYIKETSDRRLSMRQIYDQVDDRALFERVRNDIKDGMIRIRGVEELGVVYRHGLDTPAFDLYVKIDGERHEAGSIPALTLAELVKRISEIMIDAL